MISKVYYLDDHTKSKGWQLDDIDGHSFESHIFKVLSKKFRGNRSVKFFKTPKSADQGRDIELQATEDISIFGFHLKNKNNGRLRAFIECKSTNNGRIVFEKFGKNLIQIDDECIDYFILVTNGTISPYSFCKAAEQLKKRNIEFLLVDETLLESFLIAEKAPIGEFYPRPTENKSIEYQWIPSFVNGKKLVELYLVIKNLSDQILPCQVHLKTDRNWLLDETGIKIYIEPFKAYTHKFVIAKNYNDGENFLNLDIAVDNEHNSLMIKHPDLTLNFIAPFFGEKNLSICYQIRDIVEQNVDFKFINIFGQAGVGKSRVIDEALNLLDGTNIKITRVYFERSKFTCVPDLISALNNQEEISIDPAVAKSVKDVLKRINDEFFQHVIILEDAHHASKSDLESLKNLLLEPPCSTTVTTVVLTGRDDYTFPNEGYFSLIDYFETISEDFDRLSVKIPELSNEDTKNLISSIVQNIPSTALNKIHELSENIPFNIIQFIEYLLDIDLVKIINRNSVGIPNIATFNSRLNIPDGVMDLINLRAQSLNLRFYKSDIPSFLTSLAAYGLIFHSSLFTAYFSHLNEAELIDIESELVKRRFLDILPGGYLKFYHENIYNFFKDKLLNSPNVSAIAKNIIGKPAFFSGIDNLQKGMIYRNCELFDEALHVLLQS
jgi:hypothetical protein